MAIYDATGRMVRRLLNQVLSGPGMVTWDGKTASGGPAPAGIYFLRLVPSHGQEQVRRIALVR
jgi:flagellar hook assembly protein FlgD